MTVYVDDSRIRARVGSINAQWSHLTADTDEELHEFAERLGLRRSWFQSKPNQPWMNHYDVTESKRRDAIRLGAKSITWREAGKMTMDKARSAKENHGSV